MGMAPTPLDPYYLPVVPSKLVKGGWHCPRCRMDYPPGLVWGYRTWSSERDTSGQVHLVGLHRLGNECPGCGREPVHEESNA